MASTARLELPLLAAGQAQKEITHNEALMLIDMAVQAVAERVDLSSPPGAPAPGKCWIVAGAASGAWAGRDMMLACWTDGGWLFAAPEAGWRVWAIDRGHGLIFDGAVWRDEPARADGYYVGGTRVVGSRQSAVPNPAGGSVQDSESRAAIDAILTALRGHGLIAA